MLLPTSPALTRLSLAAAVALLPTLALAHDGHGLGHGAHWHASDTLGFVLIAGVALAGIWWTRRKSA